MTLRDVINRRRRKSGIVMLIGFALFGFGGVAASAHSQFLGLSAIGFVLFAGGFFHQLYGIRCPRCAGRIGFALNTFGNVFAVPSKFRFCPFCGISFDTQQTDATERA